MMYLLYFLFLSLALNACGDPKPQIPKPLHPKNAVSPLKKEEKNLRIGEKKPQNRIKKTQEEKKKPEVGKKNANEKQPEVAKIPPSEPSIPLATPRTIPPSLSVNYQLELDAETWNRIQQEFKKIDFTKSMDYSDDPKSGRSFAISNKHLFEKVYDNCRNWVFTLKMFPDLIFKTDVAREPNVKIGAETIQQHQLSRLLIPAMKVFAVICGPQKQPCSFLAEKKYAIESDGFLQEDLYKSYYEQFPNNASLKEQFRKMFSDITHFIMATRLSDIRYGNLPLFDQNKNQVKMLLVDLEKMDPTTNEEKYRSILSLLWMAHPDFHSDILEKASRQANTSSKIFIAKLDAVRGSSMDAINNKDTNMPYDLKHWYWTPIAKIAESQREGLQVYSEAKKWVKDHPIEIVKHKVQEAHKSVADNAPEKKFLQRITNRINILSENNPLYYNAPLLRNIAIPNSEGRDFNFLYRKGITKPALCRLNQPTLSSTHESILYF